MPDIINQQYKLIGGVDLWDMLMAIYRTKLGAKK